MDSPDAGDTEVAFSLAQARLAGRILAAGIEDAAKRYGPIIEGASANAQCATLTGDTSDADGDSIPADAKLVFDCSERRLGYTGTLAGVESVTDEQPNAIAWAFSSSLELHSSLTGPFGGSMVVDSVGSIDASQGGVLGPYLLQHVLDVDSVITNVRGIETQVVEDLDWLVTYAPEVEWTPGGVVRKGELTVDGAWNVAVKRRSAAALLSTPVPLTFTPSCQTRITAGRVEASFSVDASAASISVEWTGCGAPAVTYDLSADPAVGQ